MYNRPKFHKNIEFQLKELHKQMVSVNANSQNPNSFINSIIQLGINQQRAILRLSPMTPIQLNDWEHRILRKRSEILNFIHTEYDFPNDVKNRLNNLNPLLFNNFEVLQRLMRIILEENQVIYPNLFETILRRWFT